MSISAYVGLPGHGKSYGVVENVIIPALKNQRLIFSNIPMNDEKCLEDFGCSVTPFDTKDLEKNPNWFTDVFTAGAIFVFDECWRLWPAGLKANNVLEQHKTFLAEHRHLVGENGFSTEIYLVTQDLGQLASFARALVETTYRMVKRISIGLDNRFRVDIYEGCVTGSKPPASKRVRELHGGKFKKEIYQYYKSHTKSESGIAGNETRVDRRGNGLGRLSIKLGFIFILLAIPYLIYSFNSVKKTYGQPEPVKINQSETDLKKDKKLKSFSKKVPSFLNNASSLFISHKISRNGLTEIFISIMIDNNSAVLSSRDLTKLGYKVTTFSDCLVRIQGPDFFDYVMCHQTRGNQGFIKSIVSGDSTKT